MKKILKLLILIATLFILISCQSNHDVLKESHLRLVVIGDSSSTLFGSAVIYQEDDNYYYALTNEHVIDDSIKIEALDYLNTVYDVTVIRSDETIDLAIITIEKENELEVLEFADDFEIGEQVIAIGFPNSIYEESHGIIIDFSSIDYSIATDVIKHSADIDHGSSGGVLVNTDYKIIGVNFAGYVDQQEVTESYAIPLDVIKYFIL